MPRIEKKWMTGWEFTLGEPEEANFRPVELPHDWAVSAVFDKEMKQGAAQGFRNRWGTGWYRNTLELPGKEPGKQYRLEFGGIFENSTVWVNGKTVGGQLYGYSGFSLDLTNFVHSGSNQVLIRVDNTAFPADRWYSGAGMYRTVRWIILEEKHFEKDNILVRTRLSGTSAVVTVHTGVNDPVRGTLTYKDERYEVRGEYGNLEFCLPKAVLWSAEHPVLYGLKLELLTEDGRAADAVSLKIGLRQVEMIPGKGMYVNGSRVILKGVCLHQDAGCCGIAVRKEIWKERLLDLKEMGCNAIRAAHHLHSEEFLDLCDELGFYVYEECFDKWTSGLYGRYFASEWRKDLKAMVCRDRNRPSIVIWGLGNEVENQGQESMISILKMMKEYLLTLDKSRPITYAMNPHFKRESRIDASKVDDIQKFVDEEDDREIYDLTEKIERIRRIAEHVDIISCNYQEQWYPQIHQAIPDKLILGTEVYQFFKGHPDQLQNFCCENPSLVPFQYEYVIGSMVWTGFDYLGESPGYPAKGWSGSCIRTNRERRISFYILQSYWKQEPMVRFAVLDDSLQVESVKEHWALPPYVSHWNFPQTGRGVIPYMIASNCEEVSLELNGKRFYLPKPAQCPNGIITGFLPYQPGTVRAAGWRNGQEVCVHELKTSGPAVRLCFEKELMHAPAEQGFQLFMKVRALDAEDNPCFREQAYVRFQAEGGAGYRRWITAI